MLLRTAAVDPLAETASARTKAVEEENRPSNFV